MTKKRERRQWDAKDFAWTGLVVGALAIFVIYSAFDTYNSGGDYDPAINAYAEHGDATLGFVIGGLLATVAFGCGIVAAVAKGSDLSRKD